MMEVAIRHIRNGDGPDNSDSGIGGMDGALRLFMKWCGMQINQFAVINQRLKTMREPFGNKQAFLIAGRQDFTVPLQKSGRVFSDIHGNIVNFAAQATDHLAFRMRRMLEMHAADRPFFYGAGVVDLADVFFPTDRSEFFSAKKAAEKSPQISDGLPLQNKESRKGCGLNIEAAVVFYFQIFHLA